MWLGAHTATSGRVIIFRARLQNCEKRLPVSSRTSVRMEQLGSHWKDYQVNLLFEYFAKNCPENSNLVNLLAPELFF